MQLSRKMIAEQRENEKFISEALFHLPEKVLQFGTGVLLRALPDFFIDKANKQGIFNGRIVVIKSTDSGSTDSFTKQDGLYTIYARGIENGNAVEEICVNASISRVLNANSQWEEILACAHNIELKIIISNTTEVGICLMPDSISDNPPESFPGKLMAFLYERFVAFNGAPEAGMVIVPTELVTDNGSKLESILLELAHRNKLEDAFIEWLENHNQFCNSLVDRIVPGKPGKDQCKKTSETLGYTDELLTMSEVFRLWAIEGDERVKSVLSFCSADTGIVIARDITQFKELKLRLLNGTHSFNCGLAYLAGFDITRDAINDRYFSLFARTLMFNEISPAIPFKMNNETREDFAEKVLERFCNPFIDHQWLSISVQYTSKMKMRNIPLLKKFFERNQAPPSYMSLGFAGFLLFMKVVKKEGTRYWGERNGIFYEIKDDSAEYFFTLWQENNSENLVKAVLSNELLWEENLEELPGFGDAVSRHLVNLIEKGPSQVIKHLVNENK